ncbi:MAG TPA: hypothetical protein VFC78_08025 [Tepidisphaeraceae bacterium]|nr:hypothetical protein [Tepidisphaeraceae bacterium]
MRHNRLPAICEALEPRLQLSSSLDFVNPDGTVLPSGSTIDFGTVQTSQAVSKTLAIRNDGTAAVTVGLAMNENQYFDPFASNGPSGGQRLNPGQTATFIVTLDVAKSADGSTLGALNVAAFPDDIFDTSQAPQPSVTLAANIVPDPPRIVNTINFNSRQPALFTDASGNKVRVRLIGPGNGTLGFGTTGNADIKDLTLANTTAASSLIITPLGKSRTQITGNVSIAGSIGQFIAPKLDFAAAPENVRPFLTGGSFSIGGAIRTLAIGNAAGLERISIAGQSFARGTGTVPAKVLPLHLTAGALVDTTIDDVQPIASINVGSWTDTHSFDSVLSSANEQIQAPSIGTITSRGDFTVGLFTSSGALKNAAIGGTIGDPWLISGSAGNLRIGAVPANFSATVTGKLASLTVQHDDAGTIAAGSFGNILIGGNMTDAKLLAGVNLGTDGQIGGGSLAFSQDTYSAGSIDSLQVDGAGTNVFVSAGFQPADGLFDNATGPIIGGSGSAIRRIFFRKGIDAASQFVAGAFGTARIPQPVNPRLDAHFHF